jgi:hypothetical protein
LPNGAIQYSHFPLFDPPFQGKGGVSVNLCSDKRKILLRAMALKIKGEPKNHHDSD